MCGRVHLRAHRASRHACPPTPRLPTQRLPTPRLPAIHRVIRDADRAVSPTVARDHTCGMLCSFGPSVCRLSCREFIAGLGSVGRLIVPPFYAETENNFELQCCYSMNVTLQSERWGLRCSLTAFISKHASYGRSTTAPPVCSAIQRQKGPRLPTKHSLRSSDR